jgi:hypothetical protein
MSSSRIVSRKSSCSETQSSRGTLSGASVQSGGRNTDSSTSIGSENDSRSRANYSGSVTHSISNNYFDFAALYDEQSSIQTAEACAVGVSPDLFSMEAGTSNTVQDDSRSHDEDDTSQSVQQSSQAPSIPSAAAQAVGVSADCAFIMAISDSSPDGDDTSQSVQQSSQAPSIPSAAAHAVGVSADCAFIMAISDSSPDGDDTSQSVQQSSQAPSIPSAAAQAVGVSADCAFIRAITEEKYDGSGDESEAVQPLASPDRLRWDDEPGRGGANSDAASLEVSAITSVRSTYTQPPPPAALNQLRFSSLGLHGRKNESEVLMGCFERFVTKLAERQSFVAEGEGGELTVRSNANSSEVVFISGESGTGKVSWSWWMKKVAASFI